MALLDDLGQFRLEARDARPHDTTVLLQLRFTLTAHGSLATLARKVGPRAGEARQRVLHSSEGDLQDRLPGVGPVSEDLEDDLLAIDHRHVGHFLPIALLGGRERRVEHDHVRLDLLGVIDDFLGLAFSQEKSG